MDAECQGNWATAPGALAMQLCQLRLEAYAVIIEPPPESINEWEKTVRRFGHQKIKRDSQEKAMINAVPQVLIAEVRLAYENPEEPWS